MHCTKCGTVALANAKFCAECGSPISDSSSEKDIETPKAPVVAATRKVISLYILGILMAFGYAFLFIQASAGQNVPPQIGYGYIFWTGVLFYYWWKQRARKGWRGALIGTIIALVALFAAGFIVGVVGHGK